MTHFAYRNHNPGNLRPSTKYTWQGQTGVYDSGASGKFLIFESAVMGIRAVARTIMNYPRIYGVTNMREFFARYAPAGDGANDPAAYARIVAQAVGVGIDEKVDFKSYEIVRGMLPAIFRVETGEKPPYTDAQYDKAITMAGIVIPKRPLRKTGTVKGATTATVGTGISAAADALNPSQLPTLGQQLLPYAKWAGLALIFIGVGYVLWRRWDDRRRGLR